VVFVDSASSLVVDRLACHIAWVDRHGESIWGVRGLYGALAMLPIATIGATVLVLAVI